MAPIEVRGTDIHKSINELFDEEELRTLCFDLGQDYDSLRGEGKAGKARELVAYLHRHGRIGELLDIIIRLRPGSVKFRSGPLSLDQMGRRAFSQTFAKQDDRKKDDFIIALVVISALVIVAIAALALAAVVAVAVWG